MSASVPVAVEQAAFFVGLLASLRDVLGERAAAALVQFAASEAASREANRRAGGEARSLAVELDHLGELMGARFRVLEQSIDRCVVEASSLGGTADPVVARALVAGAVKGTYLARGQSMLASVAAEENASGGIRVVIERNAHAPE